MADVLKDLIAQTVEAFDLEHPTPDQLKKRASIAIQVRRIETSQVPHPDDFRLTGSDRMADDLTQGNLF